jgi:hypothetical protein
MPPGFGIVSSEQTDLHDETVPMNQSFCLKRFDLRGAANLVTRPLISRDIFPVKKKDQVHSGKTVLGPIKEAACQRKPSKMDLPSDQQ